MSFSFSGGFGAAPQQTASFGGFQTNTQPAFGGGLQQSQSTFGTGGGGFQAPQQSQSLFGTGSQTGVGGFGQPAFGQQPVAQQPPAFSLGGFGATPQQPQQTTTGFGGFGQQAAPQQTQSTFGFGAPTQPTTGFGQTPAFSTGGFGQQPQQTQTTGFGGFGQQPTTTGFGATTSTFGQQPTTGFGQPTTSTFGATNFGAPVTQPTQTGFGVGSFGLQQPQQQQQQVDVKGSRHRAFQPLVESSSAKDASGRTVTTQSAYQSITCLPEYLHKSFEELRCEDEELGLQTYVPQQQPFGTTNAFGQQPSQSLFGQPAAQQQTGFAFGQTAAPAAGQSLFGQQSTTTGFGFGAQQPAQTTSTFGFGQTPAAAAPTTSFAFGGAPATQPTTTGFGFGAPTTSSFGTGGGLFGASTSTTGTSLFGGSTTSSGFGTGSTGGFAFGATQPATTTGGFSLGGTTGSTTGTSLFGNTGGGFGTTGFGATTSSTGSGFGFGTSSSTGTGGFQFGATTGTATTSSLGTGFNFGATSTTGGFGTGASTGTSLFGSTGSSTGGGFSFGGFGSTTSSSTSAGTSTSSGFGGFSLGGTTSGTTDTTSSGLFATTSMPTQPGQPLVAKVDDNILSSFLNSSAQQISKTAVGLSQSQAMMGTTSIGSLSANQFSHSNMPLLVSHTPATPRLMGATSALTHTPRSAARLRPRSFLASPGPMRPVGGLNTSLSLYGSGLASGSPSAVNMSLSSSFGSALQQSVQFNPSTPSVALTPELLVSRRNLRKLSHIPLPQIVDLGMNEQDEKQQPTQEETRPQLRITTSQPPSATKNTSSQLPTGTPLRNDRSSVNESTDVHESVYPSLDRARSRDVTTTPALRRDSVRYPPQPQRNLSLTKDDRAALPILNRTSYFTTPSMTELSQMTREQLQQVSNFTVHHSSMGSVSWEGVTDITDLNLDELILFERNEKNNTCSVEVYPLGSAVPPVGEKLNKPAIITLKQCWPGGYVPGSTDEDEASEKKLKKYEKKLRAATERARAEFLSYSPQKGVWTFRVEQFS